MDFNNLIEVSNSEILRVSAQNQSDVEPSVVIPTYNESSGISHVLLSLRETLIELQIAFEIILVDDDSPDKTWKSCSGSIRRNTLN